MTPKIRITYLTLTLTALISTPACSAMGQKVEATPDSTPQAVARQDLSYAPSFKPVDEIAQSDFRRWRRSRRRTSSTRI